MQQGLRQHYHSCNGICHNSSLPSWGLGKNRRLSEIPPYTCFEKGRGKRGSLAQWKETVLCINVVLFTHLPCKSGRGRTLLFEQTAAQMGQLVGHLLSIGICEPRAPSLLLTAFLSALCFLQLMAAETQMGYCIHKPKYMTGLKPKFYKDESLSPIQE